MKKAAALLALGLALTARAGPLHGAPEQYAALQKRIRRAILAKDWSTARAALRELRTFENGGTDATYNLACVEALGGNKDEAFRLLSALASTHQSFAIDKDEDLAALRGDPRFEPLVAAFTKNLEPIASSTISYTIEDPGLAEDLSYVRQTRSFFVTSVLRKEIIRIDAAHHQRSVFADLSQKPGWPLLAVAADSRRHTLWATAAALTGFASSPMQAWGKDTLLQLDLSSGKVLASYSAGDDAPHAMGDMTLARNGTVFVSDGRSGAVFRLRIGSKTLERIDAGQFLSPQTPALSKDETFLFVPDYARGIGRLDLRTGVVSWLAHADDVATDGIDGLVLRGRDLYAVQNGATPARIVRFRLNRARDRIQEMEILESNSPGLGAPTHEVIVGKDLYFLANSGWSEIDQHGNVKPGHRLTAATIRRLPLH